MTIWGSSAGFNNLSSSFLPDTTGAYDLGSLTFQWRTGYFQGLNVTKTSGGTTDFTLEYQGGSGNTSQITYKLTGQSWQVGMGVGAANLGYGLYNTTLAKVAWVNDPATNLFRFVNGSLSRAIPVTKTLSFTLADGENWIICNGAAIITVTLPNPATYPGREVMFKNTAAFTVVSASANVIPLIGGAGSTAILAATAGKWCTLVSDGANWQIMQGN